MKINRALRIGMASVARLIIATILAFNFCAAAHCYRHRDQTWVSHRGTPPMPMNVNLSACWPRV